VGGWFYGPPAMKIGLVGFPGSGKTTVFNALTGLSADTSAGAARGKTNLGVVKVPDRRVDALAQLFQPKKKTYAEVTFSDVGGGGSARGLDRKVLDSMREVDALCQVVRAVEIDSAPEPPAPMREIRDLDAEMILADLDLVERRLERIKKEKANPREEQALTVIKAQLDAEKPLRLLTTLDEAAWAQFSGFRFLTLKPLLLVLNVDEGAVASPLPTDIAAHAKAAGLGLVQLSAKVEQDIAQMSPDEQREFIAALGLTEPARDRFLHAAFALLDLISMLTAGEDECRAWPIKRGTIAHRAAGKIHSDIERGFIKAEVIWWEDLIALGSEAACRAAGKQALQGKEYVMRDGDVVNFKFAV
jgi:ribosome-binding ATPase